MLRILEYVSPEKTIKNDEKFDLGDVKGLEIFFHDEDFPEFLIRCTERLEKYGVVTYSWFRSLFLYPSNSAHELIGWTDRFFDVNCYDESGYHSIVINENPRCLSDAELYGYFNS